MSDIVKNIFNATDSLNLFSSTKNLESMLSKIDTFSSGETEEERRKRLCQLVIVIRVAFVLVIFSTLAYANSTGAISTELFMGLSLLTLLMPDIVVVIMVIYFAVNNSSGSSEKKGQLKYLSNLTNFSDTSEGPSSLNKYALTQTPEVFN
jgi:hypothetical protein